MVRTKIATRVLLALTLSSFMVACGDDGDNRAALERESLERELELALQPDSTQQPTLNDAPLETIDEIVPPPAEQNEPPASAPTPSPEPARQPPRRPTTPEPRPERETTPRAPAPAPEPTPRISSYPVPAGTSFSVRLDNRISTGDNPVGSTFTATLTQPIRSADGTTLIPAGATVRGRVIESTQSGRAGEDAHLAIDFTSIEHAGQTYSIMASAVNAPVRLVNSDSRTEQAAKIGGGAAVGALLGQIVGGNTKATVAGAAIGAAAGTAVAMGTADVDAVIDEGATVTVRLDRTLTVDSRE